VTRLGEISPFGRIFLSLGAIFSEKYRPIDFAEICFQNTPKIHLRKPLDLGYFLSSNSLILTSQKILFSKAPFWAKFGQNWALFFTELLVTLFRAFRKTTKKYLLKTS
jgi:hypothetical protein